jgi:hypothetical protein
VEMDSAWMNLMTESISRTIQTLHIVTNLYSRYLFPSLYLVSYLVHHSYHVVSVTVPYNWIVITSLHTVFARIAT